MRIAAQWTPDCQGKQDFDGEVVSISTRYWPRGGGFTMFNTATRSFEENEQRPQILPHAHSSFRLELQDDEEIVLCEAEFAPEPSQRSKPLLKRGPMNSFSASPQP